MRSHWTNDTETDSDKNRIWTETEQDKGRRANTGPGGRQKSSVLSHLSDNKNNCFLATQTVTKVNEMTLNRNKNTHAPI